jgi:peptidoglycan hydrolase-like amidase
MAADGAGFREILSHYYPNTTIISIHGGVNPFSQQR